MATVEERVPPLVPGDRLTVGEFLRRWEAMPAVKQADLIGGIVYMPSPLSRAHAIMHCQVNTWIGHYAAFTPGCEPADNGTWIMSKVDAPQPDSTLRLLSEYGGQSRVVGPYPQGAPEFVVEVCLSSTSYDLHQKLELYQEKGVQEYLAVLLQEQQLRWHLRKRHRFRPVPPAADGIYRSAVFPGLWLHGQALLEGNMALVLDKLNDGLQSAEHAAFLKRLGKKR